MEKGKDFFAPVYDHEAVACENYEFIVNATIEDIELTSMTEACMKVSQQELEEVLKRIKKYDFLDIYHEEGQVLWYRFLIKILNT